MIRNSILTFLFSCTLCISAYSQDQIERVEPPNWWVGMHHNEIEILIYGKDIASYELSFGEYTGVHHKQTKLAPNRNYIFVTLEIAPDAKPGNLEMKFSKNNKQRFSYSYPILARDPSRANIQGFDTSDAIYLITPDRFVNGDPDNDNKAGLKEKADRTSKGGRHGGDVAGISQSLDYIKGLGFTAVWMNPILENDMQQNSYHGYATTDFYKVDPRYGSNTSFRALCQEASDKGMKVIMDMIVNHCGLDHWWMNDLPFDDWINQWPEYTGTNHQKTVILDPYASKIDYKQFFDGWFVPSMPDLNQRNGSMAKYLIQNTLWWIEYAGISGIRMDTYPYPDMYFMSDWTKAVMQEYPNFNIVGEEWVTRPTIVSYWQKGKENQNGYTSHLKSLMDFPLHNAMVTSLNKEKTWASSWTDLYAVLGQDYLYPDPNSLVVFPDNHDMSRIYTQLNEDFHKYKMALAYVATIRGIPQIFYGTELLMKNPGTEDHGVIRSDFPGGWQGDIKNAFTGQGLSEKEKEAQAFVRKVLNWRKRSSVIHNGKVMHFAPKNEEEIYVYFRYDHKDKVMVILSKNDADMPLDIKRYKEILGSQLTGTDIISGTRFNGQNQIMAKARSAMIIEVEK
ncbi:MAG: glycoside hydrolase family 13 protein [Bacteroidota bacterium]